MPNNSKSTLYITNAEAARIAGVSTKTIRNWRKEGKISAFKVKEEKGLSKVQIDKDEFLLFLKSREKASSKPPPVTTAPPKKDDESALKILERILKRQEAEIASLQEENRHLLQYKFLYEARMKMNAWTRMRNKPDEPTEEKTTLRLLEG